MFRIDDDAGTRVQVACKKYVDQRYAKRQRNGRRKIRIRSQNAARRREHIGIVDMDLLGSTVVVGASTDRGGGGYPWIKTA